MSVDQNLKEIQRNIPSGITLVAVSKTQPIEKIREAYSAGHRVFGENRAQELASKFEALPRDIEWHMIGHLQTNKVKHIAPFVNLIHSVDSEKLLSEINRQAEKASRVIPCLLQIHIAEEETKFGFSPAEVQQLLFSDIWNDLAHIRIEGLMGMATFSDDIDLVRREFKSLKTLYEQIKKGPLPASVEMRELSMGMSGDYRIAIEEGSTMVRVGSAIFGTRATHQI